MDYLWLRIIICVVVVVGLTLYLYDEGAHRVYDVIMSAVAILATCWLFAVLAAISGIKNKRVFDKSNGLQFTFPNNALRNLPFFLLVFIGKRNIMPTALWKKA